MSLNEEKLTEDARLMRQIRQNLNMTQPEFARYLGVSLSTISCVETGKRNLSAKMRTKLQHLKRVIAYGHALQQSKKVTADNYQQMFFTSVHHMLDDNHLQYDYINKEIVSNLYELLCSVMIDEKYNERYAIFLKNITNCMLAMKQEELRAFAEDSSFKDSVQIQNSLESIRTQDLFFYKNSHKNK